jgi:hypothetical protein
MAREALLIRGAEEQRSVETEDARLTIADEQPSETFSKIGNMFFSEVTKAEHPGKYTHAPLRVPQTMSENVDIDGGYKHGLTRSEAESTILFGFTVRF